MAVIQMSLGDMISISSRLSLIDCTEIVVWLNFESFCKIFKLATSMVFQNRVAAHVCDFVYNTGSQNLLKFDPKFQGQLNRP